MLCVATWKGRNSGRYVQMNEKVQREQSCLTLHPSLHSYCTFLLFVFLVGFLLYRIAQKGNQVSLQQNVSYFSS